MSDSLLPDQFVFGRDLEPLIVRIKALEEQVAKILIVLVGPEATPDDSHPKE